MTVNDEPGAAPSHCPPGIKAAGLIWVIIGVLQLFSVALIAMMTYGGPKAARDAAPPAFALGLRVVFAIVFIMAGRQTLKGTAPDTKGIGWGSVVFGVLSLLVAFNAYDLFQTGQNLGVPDPVMLALLITAVVASLGGLALILAGALAINGREAYLAWRASR